MFERKKILVAGDMMLDVYTIGEVMRISPEAPIPILRVLDENRRPGGAGNAALNIVSMGMDVSLFGRVGNDFGGKEFLRAMESEAIDARGILVDPNFQTPIKTRMIASGQQLLRVDYESTSPLDTKQEKEMLAYLPELLEGVALIAVSDYAKGFLTNALLAALTHQARLLNIPLIVDPKGIDFIRYRGATLIKPNLSEAIAASGLSNEAPLEEIASKILAKTEIENLMITRSHRGISLFDREVKRRDFPAEIHEVKDVTGAGDTVLAVIAAAMANKIDLAKATRLANVAAGLATQHVGCARISLADLSSRLVEIKT